VNFSRSDNYFHGQTNTQELHFMLEHKDWTIWSQKSLPTSTILIHPFPSEVVLPATLT